MRQLKLTSRSSSRLKSGRRRSTANKSYFGMTMASVARLCVTVVCVTMAFFVLKGSQLSEIPQRIEQYLIRVTAKGGLVVESVRINGRALTSKEALKGALGPVLNKPMMGLSLEAIQARLEALPWVANAAVRRDWPNVLVLTLTERYPVAIWTKGKKRVLVDREGVALTQDIPAEFQNLIRIAGDQAPPHMAELEGLLAHVPSIRQRLSLATLVGGRRWDMRLDNDIVVQLPEEAVDEALQELSRLLEIFPLSSDYVRRLDFRLPDRLIINLTPLGRAKLTSSEEGKNT